MFLIFEIYQYLKFRPLIIIHFSLFNKFNQFQVNKGQILSQFEKRSVFLFIKIQIQNLLYFILFIMFYLIKNLITQILVSASEMHLLAKDIEILKRLREKIQGRCYNQYGYIIRFVDQDCKIGDPIVQQDGCRVEIKFSALAFKPQRQQILDFLVTQVSEQYVKGILGHAIVLIPKSKIEGNWRYKKQEKAYVEQHSKETIQRDIKLRCKCFEMHVQMNYQMKIIGSLQGECLGPIQ